MRFYNSGTRVPGPPEAYPEGPSIQLLGDFSTGSAQVYGQKLLGPLRLSHGCAWLSLRTPGILSNILGD